MENFKIVATTLEGLEETLATEIEALGGTDIAVGTRVVSYTGDKALLYKSNLWLRTAMRVLRTFTTFTATDPDALYATAKQVDWSQYIAPGQTIAIDAAIHSEEFSHSKFAVYRLKDAICDFFTERGDKRPSVSVANPDIRINLHIAGTTCDLSLDSSGTPLYQRGYKERQCDAPINEVLAAGILLRAGWDGSRDLIDPMCGSGTFLIEAALIATGTPAGIFRKEFGFERWKIGENAYDEELWNEIYNDDSHERPFEHRIYGSDISRPAVEIAEGNVKSAGMAKYVTLEVKDFETYTDAPSAGCLLVCNPPYGKRLFTDVQTFYKMIGTTLKRAFQDCEAWIIAPEEEPFTYIGLKPSIRWQGDNGGIPCEVRKYELFKGRFDDFRAEGGALDKGDEGESRFERIRRPERRPYDRDDRREYRPRRDYDDRPRRDYDRDDRRDYRPRRDYDRDSRPWERRDRDYDDRPRRDYDRDSRPWERRDRDSRPRRDDDRKPWRGDRRDGDRGYYENRGNFYRNRDGEFTERDGDFRCRGERRFNPNRPMFHRDFDVSANILDFTKPEDKKEEGED